MQDESSGGSGRSEPEVHVRRIAESDFRVEVWVDVLLPGREPLEFHASDGMFGFEAEVWDGSNKLWGLPRTGATR